MRWLLPVLIGVVSLAVAGGVLAREFYQRERPQTQAQVELPTPTSLKPSEQPGSPEVKLTPDAARHPHGETVRALLEAYTNGINERNYERWKTTVAESRIVDKTKDEWRRAYRSTRNGSILVHRIESGPGRLTAPAAGIHQHPGPGRRPAGPAVEVHPMAADAAHRAGERPVEDRQGRPGTVPESRRC